MGLSVLPTDKNTKQILNAVLDTDINLIDTSIDYEHSEELIGRFISHCRSQYFPASKCGCVPGSSAGHDHIPILLIIFEPALNTVSAG